MAPTFQTTSLTFIGPVFHKFLVEPRCWRTDTQDFTSRKSLLSKFSFTVHPPERFVSLELHLYLLSKSFVRQKLGCVTCSFQIRLSPLVNRERCMLPILWKKYRNCKISIGLPLSNYAYEYIYKWYIYIYIVCTVSIWSVSTVHRKQ